MIALATLEAYVGAAYGQPPIPIVCEADASFPLMPDGRMQDGYVLEGADGHILRLIHVRQSICDAAQKADRRQTRTPTAWWVWHDERMDSVSGPALGVLMHEGAHVVLDSGDEPVVECVSFQNAWQLVRRLGVPAFVQRMLLAGIGARHEGMPDDYRKPGC